MQVRSLFLSFTAAAAMIAAAAYADPPRNWHDGPGHHDGYNNNNGYHDNGYNDRNRGGDRDWRDEHGSWHRDHDRYWRPDFGARKFAPHDRFFVELRRHNYMRFNGEPYWFQGHYVIRTFDRFGRPIIVELNPYTGEVIGVIRF